jgi:predicted O-methyltransferase YrrM
MVTRLRDALVFAAPEIARAPHLRAATLAAALIASGARGRDRALLAAAAGLLALESAQQGEATRRAVQNCADTSALTAWLPEHNMEFGGYAVDADLASVLRSHVRHGRHRSIVEFGAGLSTLTMALALHELGDEGAIVSFEASRDFTDQITQLLADTGLAERARVVHSPVGPRMIHGREVSWHDPEVITIQAPAKIDLLFVDGPVSVDSWSRWPALETLWGHLVPGSVTLLDDSRRRREHRCALRWAKAHRELELSWIDTVTGLWRAEVRESERKRGASQNLHTLLRAVNRRPAGWGKWPVRRV